MFFWDKKNKGKRLDVRSYNYAAAEKRKCSAHKLC